MDSSALVLSLSSVICEALMGFVLRYLKYTSFNEYRGFHGCPYQWNFSRGGFVLESQDMSSESVRRVSRQDIQLVQNLIERCLQLYMNQKEVVDTLLAQAKIEPGFTELVWKKLEEENREFFKAYYLRLMVKQQIVEFNKLLEQQVNLMHQLQQQSGSSAFPTSSNGSHMQQLHQNSAYYSLDHAGPSMTPASIHHAMMPNTYTNGGSSSMNANMHAAVNMPVHTGRLDAPPPSMLSTQNSNMGMNKPENGFSGNSPFMFGADANVLDTHQPIGAAAVMPFNRVEPNSQPLDDGFLDAETGPYGVLSQIPRNFSLSDLTADFGQSSAQVQTSQFENYQRYAFYMLIAFTKLSDILESYARSPFMANDNGNFLDPHDREFQVNNRRLDSISETLSFDD
ncbi:hypothetical protein ACFE04_030800 [Oxalis oulophora]